MDSDGDGIQDDRDNCVFVINPTQLDTDDDGYGTTKSNFVTTSFIHNHAYIISLSLGNACDNDDDGDGILDYVISEDVLMDETNDERNRYEGRRDLEKWTNRPSNILDNCRLIFNPNQTDNNLNGIGDDCEEDFDGDNVSEYIYTIIWFTKYWNLSTNSYKIYHC